MISFVRPVNGLYMNDRIPRVLLRTLRGLKGFSKELNPFSPQNKDDLPSVINVTTLLFADDVRMV